MSLRYHHYRIRIHITRHRFRALRARNGLWGLMRLAVGVSYLQMFLMHADDLAVLGKLLCYGVDWKLMDRTNGVCSCILPYVFQIDIGRDGFRRCAPSLPPTYQSTKRLMSRFKGTKPRRPSEIMGFVHLESTIMLLFSYAFAPGHLSRDVTACTYQFESTS
jgi:hypothetical protein